MKYFLSLLGFCALGLMGSGAWATTAQPVPVPEDPSAMPQIEIDGVGISTLALSAKSPGPSSAAADFSDSTLFFGAAQRLYEGALGSFGLGALTTEASMNGGAALFLNQAFLDVQSETWEVLIGRTDRPVAHPVDFPTLRGDDLLAYTSPGDPLSIGLSLEDQRYANIGSITLNQNLLTFEKFYVQHLLDSNDSDSGSRINSAGVQFEYLSPPGVEALQTLVSGDLGYEYANDRRRVNPGFHLVYGGGVVNLNQSITSRWDLRVEDVLSLSEAKLTDSNAATASVRFLKSPFGHPGYQVALTAGYKAGLGVAEGRSVGLALTGVRRLGQGFDLAAQYSGDWRQGVSSVVAGDTAYDQKVEIGFVFAFNATFNQHITPRRSLLNHQHQYVPN